MRKRHGWSSDSKMPSRYVHLVNSDVEDAIFKHYGIKKEDEKDLHVPIKCNFCGVHNPSDSFSCIKCGRPLDVKAAEMLDEKQETEKKMLLEKIDSLEQKYDATNQRLELVLDMIENSQKKKSQIFISRTTPQSCLPP